MTGELLTANEMTAFNSFEKPEIVKTASFSGFKMNGGILTVIMPSKSVVVLELTK